MGKKVPTEELREADWLELSTKERLAHYPTLQAEQVERYDFYFCRSLHNINLREAAQRIEWAILEEQYKNATVEMRLEMLPDLTTEQATNEHSFYKAESLARVNRIMAKDYSKKKTNGNTGKATPRKPTQPRKATPNKRRR